MLISNTENLLGFCALVTYIATLLPSNIKVVFPALKFSYPVRWLLQHRRGMGIWTFVLSAIHACVVIHVHNMHFIDKDFYAQSVSGLLILIIFALLAFTSNSWSIKKLRRNWKRLHGLTYVAALMIPWHISAKMAGQETGLTVVALAMAAAAVGLLCWRILKKKVAAKSRTDQKSARTKELVSSRSK